MTIEELKGENGDPESVAFVPNGIMAIDNTGNLAELCEQRLKADMVAILTEIQLEIDELKEPYYCCHYKSGLNDCKQIIQQKINALKEQTDGKEKS